MSSYSIRQLFAINQAIQKAVSKSRQQFEKFAEQFFSQIKPCHFDRALKILEEKLITLVQSQWENCFGEMMVSALEQSSFSVEETQCVPPLYVSNKNTDLTYIHEFVQFNCEGMAAQKAKQLNCQRKIIVSEQQNEEMSNNQIRRQRSNFFTHQVQQKISNSKIGEKHQTQIIELFAAAIYLSSINLNKLGDLSDFKKEIGELKQSYEQMEKRLQRRECLPLAQAIKCKLTKLRVIDISSQVKFDCYGFQYFDCSVSAFELFKVIHLNKGLTSVTLKGIQIKQFKQFTEILNPSKFNALAENQREEYSWINNFKPSKSLKLAINSKIQFDFYDKLPSKIKDLQFFIGMFGQLSDVTVRIFYRQIGKERLEDLLQQLRKIKRIKIEINGYGSFQQLSLLLIALSSFTEIIHIRFEWIREGSQVAIEQRLSDIFQNNQITHLGLHHFDKFPKLPFLPTLQSIYLSSGSIQSDLFAEFTKTMPNIKSIRLWSISSSKIWTINENLFDQLQTLIIFKCSKFTFGAMPSKSPSNIKLLSITNSYYKSDEYLSVILPKLANIEQLRSDDFGDGQKLLTVPSPYLQQLELLYTRNLSDDWLKAIDQKWPNLTTLKLHGSNQISPRGWSACGFKRLIQMSDFIQSQRKTVFVEIRKRGIKII